MRQRCRFGSKKKRDAPRIAIGVCILAAVIIVYVLSLFGLHFLQRSEGALPPLDLSQGGGCARIVQLRLGAAARVVNRSGDRAVGADRVGHGHERVHRGLDPAGRLSVSVGG